MKEFFKILTDWEKLRDSLLKKGINLDLPIESYDEAEKRFILAFRNLDQLIDKDLNELADATPLPGGLDDYYEG